MSTTVLVAAVVTSFSLFIEAAFVSYFTLFLFELRKKVSLRKWLVLPFVVLIINFIWELLFFNSAPTLLFLLLTTNFVFLVAVYFVSKFYWNLSLAESVRYSVLYTILCIIAGYLMFVLPLKTPVGF